MEDYQRHNTSRRIRQRRRHIPHHQTSINKVTQHLLLPPLHIFSDGCIHTFLETTFCIKRRMYPFLEEKKTIRVLIKQSGASLLFSRLRQSEHSRPPSNVCEAPGPWTHQYRRSWEQAGTQIIQQHNILIPFQNKFDTRGGYPSLSLQDDRRNCGLQSDKMEV